MLKSVLNFAHGWTGRLAICLVLYILGCTPKMQPSAPALPPPLPQLVTESSPVEVPAKNIIFLIGDGMGLAQITGGMYLNHDYTALEKFPVVGLHKSYSADNLVTDSAAGVTAFACGIKTNNGFLAVDPDGHVYRTILEEASKRGLATGLLVTSSIVHATPAGYIAHIPDRRRYDDIALAFLKTPIDIFIGGGRAYFAERQDGLDLYAELRDKGYVVEDYLDKPLQQVTISPDSKYAYLTADKEPVSYLDGRDYLVPATRKVLDYLTRRSDKGFFVMIEGSQIDWGGHANDAKYVLSEFKEFDEAIGICYEYAKRMGNTLVVVTADHETGGFAINPGSKMNDLNIGFTTGDHTAVMIPVFAYGPGSEQFGGIYENTAIYDKMRAGYGWK